MRKGWTETTLGEIAKITSGFAFSTKSWTEEGIPVIKINNVRNGKVTTENCSYVKAPIPSGSERFILSSGDLLITLTGEIGAIGVVTQNYQMLLNQRVGRVDLKSKECIREFLALFLSNDKVRLEMWSHGKGNAQLNISPKSIESLQLSLPPLQEQKRIVDLISSVDSYIDALQHQADSARKSRNAVLHEMLSAGGDGWTETRLGEVAQFLNGKAYSKEELLTEGKYRVLRVGNFFSNQNWYWSDLELEENKYCDSGDLLYAWSASFGPRIWKDEKVIYHYHIWKVVEDQRVLRRGWIKYWLEDDVERMKAAVGTGSIMMHITKGDMEKRKIAIPPLGIQDEQITILNRLDDFLRESKTILEKTRDLRNALLSDLLSGDHEIPASYDMIMGAA